jgi:DNA repair protein RecO (recombination protein O)
VLRIFELRLLELLGFGLELETEAASAVPLAADGYYRFRPSRGLVRARAHDAGALAGASLMALREERLGGTRALEDARRLLHAALAACLEGRPLATRAVARSMVRKAAQR